MRPVPYQIRFTENVFGLKRPFPRFGVMYG